MYSVESKSIRASRERKHGFEKRRKIPFLVGPLFRVIESEETYTKWVSESLEKMINLTCRVVLISSRKIAESEAIFGGNVGYAV